MCKKCIKESSLDRGNSALENGAYLLNLLPCHQCQQYNLPKSTQLESKDGNSTEYTHECSHCGHLIAKHVFEEEKDEQYFYYTMQCALCGFGHKKVSIQ